MTTDEKSEAFTWWNPPDGLEQWTWDEVEEWASKPEGYGIDFTLDKLRKAVIRAVELIRRCNLYIVQIGGNPEAKGWDGWSRIDLEEIARAAAIVERNDGKMVVRPNAQRRKPGPEMLGPEELEAIHADFKASRLSKTRYCELRGVSRRQLDHAIAHIGISR